MDKTISFRPGYQYTNLLKSEITTDYFKDINLRDAKIGSIVSTKENIELELNAKFIKGNIYLAKIDFEEINRFGNIKFQYGVLESTRDVGNQIFLLFKANDNNKLKLLIEANDIIPYEINLKHVLLIDTTKISLQAEDIPCLPFI